MNSLKELGRGSNPPKNTVKLINIIRVKVMSFEDFNFTNRTHCPHCKTGMMVIDRKVISCPLCEVMRNKKRKKFEK
jgi:hypothetical protein